MYILTEHSWYICCAPLWRTVCGTRKILILFIDKIFSFCWKTTRMKWNVLQNNFQSMKNSSLLISSLNWSILPHKSSVKLWWKLVHCSTGSRISLGVPTLRVRVQTRYFAHFFPEKTAWNLKKNNPEGCVYIQHHSPPRYANVLVQVHWRATGSHIICNFYKKKHTRKYEIQSNYSGLCWKEHCLCLFLNIKILTQSIFFRTTSSVITCHQCCQMHQIHQFSVHWLDLGCSCECFIF